MNQQTVVLTERAAAHVRKFLASHGGSVGLRLGVKPTGCSGYKYVVTPAEKIDAADQRFESNGVQLVVSNDDLKYLAGMEVDFVREGLNEGFRFINPNVQDACGCGESVNFINAETKTH